MAKPYLLFTYGKRCIMSNPRWEISWWHFQTCRKILQTTARWLSVIQAEAGQIQGNLHHLSTLDNKIWYLFFSMLLQLRLISFTCAGNVKFSVKKKKNWSCTSIYAQVNIIHTANCLQENRCGDFILYSTCTSFNYRNRSLFPGI